MMNSKMYIIFLFFSLAVTAHAADYDIKVLMRRSSDDPGSYVELKTRVRIWFSDEYVILNDDSSVLKNKYFSPPKELYSVSYTNRIINKIEFRVYEEDGGSNGHDGVCFLVINPPSFPDGLSRYECIQEKEGLGAQWQTIIEIDTTNWS